MKEIFHIRDKIFSNFWFEEKSKILKENVRK